jgi:Ferredoxin subunits of nitrite reductase and ring-hydroxylating dioxygenases
MGKEVLACRSDELEEGTVRVVAIGDVEIGLIRHKGDCFAYQNICPHQGGPVCDGLLMPQVEDVIDGDGRFICQKFNEDGLHIVCPWHGYEYKVTTGEHAVDPAVRLRKYEISERQGGIYVTL